MTTEQPPDDTGVRVDPVPRATLENLVAAAEANRQAKQDLENLIADREDVE